MGMKEKIKERVERIKDNHILEDPGMFDEKGRIIGVRCWKCGTQIAGYVDDSIRKEEKKGDKHYVYIKQRFMGFENYAKAYFRLDNGSEYSPTFCKTCAKTATVDDAEKILARHIAIDGKKKGVSEKYMDKLMARSVAEKVKVED